MLWDRLKDPLSKYFHHVSKLFGISDMAGVALPAKINALDPGKDISHRSDHFLVDARTPLSAHHRNGQVQLGVGIKAYPEPFHGLQVVDLARDELTVGRNQRREGTGSVRQKAWPPGDHLGEDPNGSAWLTVRERLPCPPESLARRAFTLDPVKSQVKAICAPQNESWLVDHPTNERRWRGNECFKRDGPAR